MQINKKLLISVIVIIAIIIVSILGVAILKQTDREIKNGINPTAQTSNEKVAEKLQLTVKPDKSVYKKGEAIHISGQIENLSGQELYFYITESSLAVMFDIFDPQGDKVEVAYPISDPGLPTLKEFALISPGESLSKIFEILIPEKNIKSLGVYSISITYKVSQDWYFDNEKSEQVNPGAWTGILKSNTIKIEIQ